MPPGIALIATCHNQAAFLAEAIESVLAQTLRPDEIVVIDDGSTDETVAVAARYPEVRCISQPRAGLPAARNAGFRATRGEFVAFLDADDRLLPGALEAGVRALEAHPQAACVAGHYRLIDAGGAHLAEWTRAPVDADPYAALLRRNHIGMHATVLYRRHALGRAGGFNPALPAAEDYDLLLRLARDGEIVVHGALIAEYRRHSGNVSLDAALMLRATLQVHRAQWPYAKRRSVYREAYRAGRAFYQEFYGEPLVDAVRRAARAGRRRAALRGLGTLVVHYPRGAAACGREAILGALGLLGLRRRLRAAAAALRRPPARVDFGSLRRTAPYSRSFGYERGQPVDRAYIEAFLRRHAQDIRGRVLEFGDPAYTRRFGGARVTQVDVWHVSEGHPPATLVGDLSDAPHVPAARFDAIICTQTLHLIYDLRAAVRTLYRLLAPGGVALVTVPGISPIGQDIWRERWCWSLTATAARRLFGECFPSDAVLVETYGNVLAATAFLYGLAAHELAPEELDVHDPHYPVTVAVRARKPAEP